MASLAISAALGFAAAAAAAAAARPSSGKPSLPRNMLNPSTSLDFPGKNRRVHGLSLKLNEQQHCSFRCRALDNLPIVPTVMTPGGSLDLMSVLFHNRIIFIGDFIDGQVAQHVISQLLTLAAVDKDADILIYINCSGGSMTAVLSIYDCMSWIKPKVGTVCFGMAASHAALILAGGEKGMRYAMPNARIMIHQPQMGTWGNRPKIKRQLDEGFRSRLKFDKMFAALTGRPLEMVQEYTDRDRFFSAAEALDFGLIDGLLETEY